MEIYGIIGRPLAHSYSPEYFNSYFQQAGIPAVYHCFELSNIHELPSLLDRHPNIKGFNVTIPYKEAILPFLNSITTEAQIVGAVNCVKVVRHNNKQQLIGYNTDVYGFEKALHHFSPSNGIKALVLGNGGAAKAVRYVLHALDIETITVSRTPQRCHEISYTDIPDHIADHHLIVNTTPLGTWPKVEEYPDIPYSLLTSEHYLFDLVYHPETTTFMKKGQLAGAHTCNGYEMWLKQAEKNREIWINENNLLPSQRF